MLDATSVYVPYGLDDAVQGDFVPTPKTISLICSAIRLEALMRVGPGRK